MGDSGGSVVSVDVERISFGGKVSPPSHRFLEIRAVWAHPFLAVIWAAVALG